MASVSRDGSIKICRAGHMPTFWYKNYLNDFEIISPAGIAIGLNDKGVFEKTLEEVTIKPMNKDIIFFFTDGISEAMNQHFQLFGEDNIKRIIKNNADKSSSEIRTALLNSIAAFRGSASQNDDLTFVILKAD
jgi:sigma-B regulation protein RsbU (phosphoserine phosphatase)